MAPVTRCEARASHTGIEHGVQLEQILENFEQCMLQAFNLVRRKHIAQNRDIVRANTLAQLRIRELEARVMALEQERAEQSLQHGKQQAHAQRLQYALDCIRVGWETMAQGLEEAGVNAQMGHSRFQQQEESNRISLQHGLPTTRSHIARSLEPMTQIPELVDESVTDMNTDANIDASAELIEGCLTTPLQGDICPATITRRRHSRRHSQSIQPTIPTESMKIRSELLDNPSSPSTDILQQASTSPCELASSINDESLYDQHEPTEQGPSMISSHSSLQSNQVSCLRDTPNLHNSLSSEVDDLVSSDHLANTPYPAEQEADPMSPHDRKSPTQGMPSAHAITKEPPSMAHATLAESDSAITPSAPLAEQAAIPNNTAPRKRNRSSRVSMQDLVPGPDMPLGSRRARKSVNYALPKLNTKMRKPDHLVDQDKDKTPKTIETDLGFPSENYIQDSTQSSSPSTATRKVGAKEQAKTTQRSGALRQDDATQRADTIEQANDTSQVDVPEQASDTSQANAPEQVENAEQADASVQSNITRLPSRQQQVRQTDKPTPHTLLTSTASMPVRSATPHTKRPMPPSAKLERFRKFSKEPLKERKEQPSAWLLQEQSTQDMPTWASSLLNLASPEPRKPVKSTPRASMEFHGNTIPVEPAAISSSDSRRARRRSQKENHVR